MQTGPVLSASDQVWPGGHCSPGGRVRWRSAGRNEIDDFRHTRNTEPSAPSPMSRSLRQGRRASRCAPRGRSVRHVDPCPGHVVSQAPPGAHMLVFYPGAPSSGAPNLPPVSVPSSLGPTQFSSAAIYFSLSFSFLPLWTGWPCSAPNPPGMSLASRLMSQSFLPVGLPVLPICSLILVGKRTGDIHDIEATWSGRRFCDSRQDGGATAARRGAESLHGLQE